MYELYEGLLCNYLNERYKKPIYGWMTATICCHDGVIELQDGDFYAKIKESDLGDDPVGKLLDVVEGFPMYRVDFKGSSTHYFRDQRKACAMAIRDGLAIELIDKDKKVMKRGKAVVYVEWES